MSARDPTELILDAALASFVAVGFERTTIAEIRRHSGISNGGLFHRFATKEAIAEALYLRGIADYQEGLLKALAPHGASHQARAAIRAAVHHHLRWVESHRDLAWFMYERGRPDWQPAHGAAVRKLNRATAGQVRHWLAPLAAAGAVRDLPLTVLAACVVGPAHFVAQRWLSGMISARPTTFTDALAEAAWAALAPRKPRRAPEPRSRPSVAARIEAAALAAVCAADPATTHADWAITQLTISALAAAPAADAAAPVVRLEAEGRIALIDLAVRDRDGDPGHRGHVVCVRGSGEPA
jgi:AcrR family transcriptional regulator